ncbi:hypothetical protein [Sphingobacterium endophyticum]|uniref:hypothetical protein n=1 Tax=Sphingobacterium endophyticum TaxID=2546448 RepID=UPI0012E2FB74|nr:hypothetical protein [Sphingobacterium endophyticum]
MKRISIQPLIIFLFVLFGSCSKDSENNPDIDQPEKLIAPYITMKIDGKLWTSERSKEAGFFYFDLNTDKYGNVKKFLVNIRGTSTNEFTQDQDFFAINFDLLSPTEIKQYELPLLDGTESLNYFVQLGHWKKESDNSSSLIPYAVNQYHKPAGPFKVNITALTPDAKTQNLKYLSGTFEGDLKKEDGTLIKITEGKFVWEE